MKKINICFTLLCGVLTLGSVALAQDAALIQAARKEGKVVWHTSLALPSSTAIAHYFQNKYKGIEVEVHRNGSQRVTRPGEGRKSLAGSSSPSLWQFRIMRICSPISFSRT